jgi:flagellar basal-body rod protein FlgF
MLADEAAQDAITQNLANANTVGYKRDITSFSSFPSVLLRNTDAAEGGTIGPLGTGAQLSGVATDLSEGPIEQTDNPLDVAINGPAFLAVQTPQGVLYTRDGSLTQNAQGELVQASSGFPVLDLAGRPITLPANAGKIMITSKGTVEADGISMGQLQLAAPANPSDAVKQGNSLYQIANPVPAGANSTVQQGYLESSNVNIVQEMVAMIAVQRAYETGQKMIQTEDNATSKAVNDVAKLS